MAYCNARAQLALYLFSYSAFLEVMLLGNFSEGYLNSIEQSISEYSYQYRTLYTDCYNLMETFSKSSVQAGMLNGLATASKLMGEAISKIPLVSKSQLDENMIEVGGKLGMHGDQRTITSLSSLAEVRMNVTIPFIENIRMVNELYNKPIRCMMDGNGIYIQQLAG